MFIWRSVLNRGMRKLHGKKASDVALQTALQSPGCMLRAPMRSDLPKLYGVGSLKRRLELPESHAP